MVSALRKLFGKRAPERPAASVAPGRVVYAIGDVHGHRQELETLLELIAEDRAQTPEEDAHLVYLGDYIDRGPDSRGVIERLRDGPHPAETVHFLQGNHERVLLDIVDHDAGSGTDWLFYGGFELLASYGIPREELLRRRRPLRQSILETIPEEHLDFLRAMPTHVAIDDYFFAHAGVRPGVDLDAQESRDLLWIREDFVGSRRDHGKVVVHGHTIQMLEDTPNRIGLDTGCYAGGSLSAVRLHGDTRRYLSVPSTGISWSRRR